MPKANRQFFEHKILNFNAFSYSLIIIFTLSCNTDSNEAKKYNELTEKDYEHKIDTVDGEAVYYKTAISANTSQNFTNLDDSQKLFIKQSLEYANTLIKKYQPASNIDNFTPQNLDSIINLWNNDSSKFTCSKSLFINSIGTAFGSYLVTTYKMKWTIITDENGADYATTIAELNISDFPLNSVAKAIDQREGSLHQISLMTKKRIADLKNDR